MVDPHRRSPVLRLAVHLGNLSVHVIASLASEDAAAVSVRVQTR